VTNQFLPSQNRDVILAKALDILTRDYMKSQKLGEICQVLAQQWNQAYPTAFFVAVMDGSPHKEVQAEACLAMAFHPLERARITEELRKNPAGAKDYADEFGKQFAIAVQKEDEGKLRAESEKHFGRFVEKYSGGLSSHRLAYLSLTLSNNTDNVSEAVLRHLLLKDDRDEVRGAATLYLAVVLRRRADLLADQEAENAAKLRTESEGLLEQAIEKYADIPLVIAGGVGKQAKKELFALRNLSIGKFAPDIEGEDQLGKRFNLRDYRGKVVLLDFWSQH
jgi:AhpC/TSA family